MLQRVADRRGEDRSRSASRCRGLTGVVVDALHGPPSDRPWRAWWLMSDCRTSTFRRRESAAIRRHHHPMRLIVGALALVLAELLACGPVRPAAAQPVDLALVMAVPRPGGGD